MKNTNITSQNKIHGADEYSVRLNVGVEEQKRRPERGVGSILFASNDGKYAIIDISP